MSARLIESGHVEDLERELAALQRLFDQERAAAEADMDAEESEHVSKIAKTLSGEHTDGLRDKQRELLKIASDACPASEQVALQRLIDQHRKDIEGIEAGINLEKDRQMADLRVGLVIQEGGFPSLNVAFWSLFPSDKFFEIMLFHPNFVVVPQLGNFLIYFPKN